MPLTTTAMPIPKPIPTEILPENLREHRAVKAWSRLEPRCVGPEKIEILKLKTKTVVYRLVGLGPGGSAVIAKKCLARTGKVEQMIYQELLPRLPHPALRCYGYIPEPEGEFSWLFLEDAGAQKYSPANEEHRALAGRWLATVHGARVSADLQTLLPDRGPGHYLHLLQTARADLARHLDNPVLSANDVALLRSLTAKCDVIEAHWGELERCFGGWRRAIVHGDFVVKNLRVRPSGTNLALLVFDWEMAGWGVPASDLAQVDRCARADLHAYHSMARQDFPQLDVRDIERLTNYGNLLRVVDEIYWATLFMVRDAYKSLLKPLQMIGKYEGQLAASLHAVNWSSAAGWEHAPRAGIAPSSAKTN